MYVLPAEGKRKLLLGSGWSNVLGAVGLSNRDKWQSRKLKKGFLLS